MNGDKPKTNDWKEPFGRMDERVNDLERNVSKLWDKVDGMQKITLAIFISLSLNLIGVIAGIIIIILKSTPR